MSILTILLASESASRRKQMRWALSSMPDLKVTELLPESASRLSEDLGKIGWEGRAPRTLELLHAIGEVDADVAVISRLESPKESALCSHLLQHYPDLTIVAVSGNSREILVWQRRTECRRFEGTFDEAILCAVGGRRTDGIGGET